MALRPARFCPYCAARLTPADDHGILRPTCSACGFIAYQNPAPAVGVILEREGQIVLVERRFEPKAGLWSLPAGFMEYAEAPEETAIRETREETGLAIEIERLHGAYRGGDDPRTRVILLVYVARITGGNMQAGDDAAQVALFPVDKLPELAFRAHEQALRDYARNARERLRPPSRPRTTTATARTSGAQRPQRAQASQKSSSSRT
jgi:8-oxo-dGTP diphosphatase